MASLLDRMQSSGSIKTAEVVSKSAFLNVREIIPTPIPIINVAFSGRLDGGFVPGLTILAGDSRTFKTLLSLLLLKSYLDKYDDGIAIIYDVERGMTVDYLTMIGIDTERVVLIRDIFHIEEMKFDMIKRLNEVKKGEHVFVMVDSIGQIASKKEIEDAIEEKSVADMTRAKALRSFLRVIMPHLLIKDIPCVMIAHTYNTMELYSKPVIGGGTAIMYMANQAFIITRAQEKNSAKELTGWNFTINIEKSRFVRDKAKLTFTVTFEEGIDPTSGLLEEAIEYGIIKQGGAWYTLNFKGVEKKLQSKDMDAEFWQPILLDEGFQNFIVEKYKLNGSYHEENIIED